MKGASRLLPSLALSAAAVVLVLLLSEQPLRPAFRGHRTGALWVDPADHHPNEVAHRLAAEHLLPAVRALGRPRS